MAQIFVNAPIFFSLEKGASTAHQLDITYQTKNDTFHFSGPELLGALDLRVFQAVVAAATSQRTTKDGMEQLFSNSRFTCHSLKATGDLDTQRLIATNIQISKIAESMGYKRASGDTYNRLKDSLRRLNSTEFSFIKDGVRSSSRLISEAFFNEVTKDYVVCLNHYSSIAVLNKNNYIGMSLIETAKLKSDASKILHRRLHWINRGQAKSISLPFICRYIYGSNEDTSASARSRRKKCALRSLNEIRELLGWSVEAKNADSFKIRRPN